MLAVRLIFPVVILVMLVPFFFLVVILPDPSTLSAPWP